MTIEEQLRLQSAAMEAAGHGIVITNRQGIILYINPAFTAMTGYGREEALGQNPRLLKSGKMDPRVYEDLWRTILAGNVWHGELINKRKDGSLYVEFQTITPVHDARGNITHFIAVKQDISERKQAEAALRVSEQRLLAIIDNMSHGVVFSDLDGRLYHWNRAALHMHGFSSQDECRRRLPELREFFELSTLDGQVLECADWPLARILRGERLSNFNLCVHRRDRGWTRVFSYGGDMVTDLEGRPVAFLSIIDITEQVRAAEALQEMNVQLEQRVAQRTHELETAKQQADRALENLRHIEWLITKSTDTEPQRRASRHQPQPYGDLVPLNTSRVVAGAARQEILADLVDDYLDLLDTSAAIYEKNGDYALGLFSSGWCRFMDETSRRSCGTDDNRAALASGKWHCHEACWKTSRQSIETGQPADLECLGGIRIYAVPVVADGAIVGSINFGYGDPPRDAEKLGELAQRYGTSVEVLREKADAYESRPPYLIELAKLRLQSSARLLGMIIERQRAEHLIAERNLQLQALNRSLESAKTQAEQASRAKSEFLSRMSHELRTPLNGILGFGQRLAKSDLAERDQDRVRHVLKAGQHLLELINEILDLSRIETGRLTFSPEPLSMAVALGDAVELVRPLAAEHQIELHLDAPPADCYVLADKQRLTQVLLNLLSNAIKYNRSRGSVSVGCSQTGPERLCLSVRDTGIGIAADRLPHLFEPFNRLGAEQSGIEGTGLGLALSRGLVELMEGRITVESTPGSGTTVRVELPAAASRVLRKAAALPRPSALATDRHTLLYIEDNLDNVTLIEDVLADCPGIRLLTAMQGGIGLDLAAQHHPDLILLDVHLPDMMGDEFLRRLHADPALAGIPVVVLSADATTYQIARLRALGACDYLTKPLDVEKFLTVIDDVLHPKGAAP